MVWLPTGLEITEAPEALVALPSGELSTGSIIVSAPAYHRIFRLDADPRGVVRLHEEPIL
jgi:hypothetical protein